MSPPDPARKLAALLKRLNNGSAAPAPPADPWMQDRPETGDALVWHLVFSFMAWEAGTHLAVDANRRLHDAVVDYNELRVCLPDEVAAILGPAYPLGRERGLRIRAALSDIYRREHRVTLAHLPHLGKREARQYLDSLEGMHPFVAARLSLLSLDAHAFPLDERLRQALVEEQALPADLDLPAATGWLERHFHAGEAAPAYILLEGWMSTRREAQPAGAQDRPRRRTTRP